MAIALGWGGYADTNLNFSEFSNSDYTLVLRFMAQYPYAYEGPFVAENGSGTFFIGQGDHNSIQGTKKMVLLLKIGNHTTTYSVPVLSGEWRYLALHADLGRTKITYTLFLDALQVGPPLVVPKNSSNLPQGTLRFGKRTTGAVTNGRNAQYYGLLDDIAIFKGLLTSGEMVNLNVNVPHLVGNEKNLLFGYSFGGKKRSAKLNRPVTYHGNVKKITTSSNRNNATDSALLPMPSGHQPMDLPFPAGEAWLCNGGINNFGSHDGMAAFAWDFVADGQATEGRPFYASAPGKVVSACETSSPGTANYSNVIDIRQAPDEYCSYLHFVKNSSQVSLNDNAKMGQQLALTGNTGTNGSHMHIAVNNKPDLSGGCGAAFRSPGMVTIPVAFSDYEVKGTDGKWKSVSRGIPQANEIVRNPPSPVFGVRSLLTTSAITRGPNSLDVVATDTSGRAWVARWRPNTYAKNWDRWRPVLKDIAKSNTPATVVSRDDDKLDVFIAGQDGKTYTGAWDEHVANAQWRGWWNILKGAIPTNGVITAVARDANKLDVFLVSNDGGIYTAAYDHHVADGKWRGWWRIKNLIAKPGAPVSVVSRDPNKLDIFVTAIDGRVYTAAWDQHVDDGKWRGWWKIKDLTAPSGAPVSVVARDPNKLDVFVVGNNGKVWTAAYDRHAADGKWRGWWQVGNRSTIPGTSVSVVSRESDNLDIFVTGIDNKIYTAAYDRRVADGKWRGWWRVGNLSAKTGSAVAAVSRASLKLDIFAVGSDNKLYTAAWDHHAADGEWQGWWRIGG